MVYLWSLHQILLILKKDMMLLFQQTIYCSHQSQFDTRILQESINSFVKYKPQFMNIERLFGTGMFFSQGNETKRKRRIMSQVFHDDFVKSRVPNTKQCLSYIFDQIDKNKIEVIDITSLLRDLICNITINSFFGNQTYKCFINDMEFSKFFVQLIEDVSSRNNSLFGFIFPCMLKYGLFQIDRSINERIIIKFNKMSPEEIKIKKYKDIFAAMYFSGYVNTGQKNEVNFSLKEFVEQFALFVIAGTEIFAASISKKKNYWNKLISILNQIRIIMHKP